MTSGRGGVAAFDFDGTLIREDSFPRFLTLLLGRRKLTVGMCRAGPAMVSQYREGGRDAAKVALLAHTVTGLPSEYVAERGEEFGRRLIGRVRPDMRDALAWHQERGHERIIVSASLAVYLEPFGRMAGFDRVIATKLEVGGHGRLTGRLDGPNVRGRQKAVLLGEWMASEPRELWAYGNSAGDRELLAMADHPVWAGRHRPRLA